MLINAAPSLLNDDCDCPCSCCELVSESVTLYDVDSSTFYSSAGEGIWRFGTADSRRGDLYTTWGNLPTSPKLCWVGGANAKLSIWINPPAREKAGKYFFFKRMRITWGCDGEFTSGWIPSRVYTITLPICSAPEVCTIALEAEYESRTGGGLSCIACGYDAASPLWSEFPLVGVVTPSYGTEYTNATNCVGEGNACFSTVRAGVESALPLAVPLARTDVCNFAGVASVTGVSGSSPECVGSPLPTGFGDTTAGIDIVVTWAGNVPTIVSYEVLGTVVIHSVGAGASVRAVGTGVPTETISLELPPQLSGAQWCATLLNFASGKTGISPAPSPSDETNDCVGSTTTVIY